MKLSQSMLSLLQMSEISLVGQVYPLMIPNGETVAPIRTGESTHCKLYETIRLEIEIKNHKCKLL